MIIQPLHAVVTLQTSHSAPAQRQSITASSTTFVGERVAISDTARKLSLAYQNGAPQAINEYATNTTFTGDKGTMEHLNFLFANDDKFAALMAKEESSRTSSELSYMAKATGLPNSMDYLSSEEKGLHDKLVGSGNSAAIVGLRSIALIRMGRNLLGVPGAEYDAINRAITPDNIKDYFLSSIVDPTGLTQKNVEALAMYLKANPETS